MPIDHWLNSLPQASSRFVETDLGALAGPTAYPFLNAGTVRAQITRLSGHLAREDEPGRRLAIGYSLYLRQMDVIQEASVRTACAGACPRPPVGCCNAEHHMILSTADLMFSLPSPAALRLAHVITGMQRRERDHSASQGMALTSGHCSCLAATGCALRLFKSPRCAHYLCPDVENTLLLRHGEKASAFIGAMRAMARGTISSSRDFTSPPVLAAAALIFPQMA